MAVGAVLAVGSILTALGSSYLEYKALKDQAQAQQIYQDWYKEENTKSINSELTTNLKQVQNRYFEELQNASFQNQLAANQNLQSERAAEASALETGLSTGTIENLFASYERNQAMNDYMGAQSAKNKGYQLNVDMESLRARAQNAINQVSTQDPNSIATPNLGAALLGGIGTSLKLYGNYRTETYRDNRYSTMKNTPIPTKVKSGTNVQL